MSPVDLPDGIEHGTPAGHEAGCKGDRAGCPALHTHGMTCTSAYLRATTTPDRYFKAKARDPRPAAIARTLGYRPTPATDAAQPLAESSQDRREPDHTPQVPDAPAKGPAPAERDAAGRREEMGHPDTTPQDKSTSKENPMPAPKQPRNAPTPPTVSDEAGATSPTPQLIREWAHHVGLDVNPRGKVRTDVVDAYLAAHPTTPKADPTPTPKPAPKPAPAPDVTAEDLDHWADDHPEHTRPITDEINDLRPRIDMPTPTHPTNDDNTLADPADVEPDSAAEVTTPAEFAARWNRLTDADRMAWITSMRLARDTSQRCLIEDHAALVTLRDTRPDWATIATTEDLTTALAERDSARRVAERFCAEADRLETREESALTLTLEKWAVAVAERDELRDRVTALTNELAAVRDVEAELATAYTEIDRLRTEAQPTSTPQRSRWRRAVRTAQTSVGR